MCYAEERGADHKTHNTGRTQNNVMLSVMTISLEQSATVYTSIIWHSALPIMFGCYQQTFNHLEEQFDDISVQPPLSLLQFSAINMLEVKDEKMKNVVILF